MRVEVGGLALELTDDQVVDLRQQLGVEMSTNVDGLIDSAAAAKLLGVSAEYVREHAVELGGRKLNDSSKAPWRFDPAKIPGVPGGPPPGAGKLNNAARGDVESPVKNLTPRRRRKPAGAGLLESRGRKP
jgi:hypothetical protein